jgi:hypothetical protein
LHLQQEDTYVLINFHFEISAMRRANNYLEISGYEGEVYAIGDRASMVNIAKNKLSPLDRSHIALEMKLKKI